jgi:hypothetical protein
LNGPPQIAKTKPTQEIASAFLCLRPISMLYPLVFTAAESRMTQNAICCRWQ